MLSKKENKLSAEEKVLLRSEKFYIKCLEDLSDTDSFKNEYESLYKAYKKLAKRHGIIIKHSDSEQIRTIKAFEKSENNIKKLKSHVISKVSNNTSQQNQLKETFQNELKIQKKLLVEKENELKKVKKQFFDLKVAKKEIDVNELNYQNKIISLKKDIITIEDLVKTELAQSNYYKFSFSLIKVLITDIDNIKQQLLKTNKYTSLISGIKKSIKSSVKPSDIIIYNGKGIYYIIYHNVGSSSLENIIQSLKTKRRIEDIDIYFTISHTTNNGNDNKVITIKDFIDSCNI